MIDWNRMVNTPVMGVFGEEARYLPAGGGGFDVPGTFHEAYKSLDLAGGTGVITERPALGVLLSDFPILPKQKDQVVITATALHAGGTYVVKEVQLSGVGGALLLLNYVGE